jgi:multicomponent K+:H+ antiporter subunit D
MFESHLAIVPIVLPLLVGAALVFIDERHHTTKLVISIAATALLVVLALILLARAAEAGESVSTYRLGNWPVPFGIVLVVDRLSALMVTLTSVLGLTSMLFSAARWHRAGQHYHSLFQLLLMGLNGAFLTGDLFNLFVFFELLLAASYGLALHGSGKSRVRAGLQYIAVNLATSSLFLLGVSLIYGATGTLNMADLAQRIPLLTEDNRVLFETGAALLGLAFLVKAGMWPVGLWLPTTYAVAAPPVAAMFTIMSKVGVYVILRLTVLVFGDDAGSSAGFGQTVLLYGGLATIAFGTIGVLASQVLARMAAFSVLVSAGTLLALVGLSGPGVTAGLLFYLVASTLGLSCFFLVIELVERGRAPEDDVLAVTLEAYGDEEDETPEQELGVATPATLALLGLAFGCCALLIACLPPLPGFVGKFAVIHALLNSGTAAEAATVAGSAWAFITLVVISGLGATIALLRAGINTFWVSIDSAVPRVRIAEIVPILLLLGSCVLLSLMAGPVMGYMEATADALHAPGIYATTVLGPEANGGAK